MALLTVHARQSDPVFQAADVLGDSFANDGDTELLVMNPGPSAITVIAIGQRKCSHGFLDNWIVTVDPGSLFRFGPFLSSQFNNASNITLVGYSSVTGVTVAAQRLK